MVNALTHDIPVDAYNLINKAIMRPPTVTADRSALLDSPKNTHSFTQFVDDRLNWGWKWMFNWLWIDSTWRVADRYGFFMTLELDWYCFGIDWTSGRRRHFTVLPEILTCNLSIYAGTLTLVQLKIDLSFVNKLVLSQVLCAAEDIDLLAK